MKVHSSVINSVQVGRLYSGNNRLESIKKQNHNIDGPYLHIFSLSADPDLNRISFSSKSFYHNNTFIFALFHNWNAKFILYWLR